MRFTLVFSALATALIWGGAALAQDLSVDEVLGVWQKQKQVFREAESSGLGQTRGLKLVTVDGPDAESAAAPEGVAVIANTQTEPADPNKPLVEAGKTASAPLVFGQLDPELQVNLQIKFGFDSAALSEDQRPRLDKICQAMKLSNVQLFRIIGHTDTAGTDAYNERLSVLRAKEVARYLVEDCGVTATRLETLGMGERFPLNQNDPVSEENRRVEFQALS